MAALFLRRGKCQDVTVEVERIGGQVPPIAVPQGAKFRGSAGECRLMEGVGIADQEIEFGSRYAPAEARVGKRLAKKLAYADFRHDAQDGSAGKKELTHSGNIRRGSVARTVV